jgi:hypothetical protein
MESRGRVVHRVNGERSIEDIHADIMQRLGLS